MENLMKVMRSLCALVVFTCLSGSLTAGAHASFECETRYSKQNRLEKWYAQRDEVLYLESGDVDFNRLMRIYRGLIQDLFATSPEARELAVATVFPRGAMRGLDYTLPTHDFTAALIDAMRARLTPQTVLDRLHSFADLEAVKLAQ